MQTVILDNGAAEPEGLGRADDLIKMLGELKPDELALPDVLGYGSVTVSLGTEFMNKFEDEIRLWGRRLGFVAQGRTLEDAKRTVSSFASLSDRFPIQVAYLPRLLLKETHTMGVRLKLAEWTRANYPQFQIHLFGASSLWPGEMREAAEMQFIRSMDTSLPYNYAYAEKTLLPRLIDKPIIRPNGYFELEEHDFPNVDVNIQKVLQWSRA
jgi:hypothetical protein